jgi:hypothetical protein
VAPQQTYETRTHQPGIEALIEVAPIDPDLLEHKWGENPFLQQNVPWGWFVLIGIILTAAVLWSLNGVKQSETLATKIHVTTESVLDKEAREDAEADQLITKIDTATRKFFETTDVESLARLVRQPERVRPLMDRYYGGKPIPLTRLRHTKQLQPLTLNNQGNFWIESVELTNHETRNILLEILDSGEPKIDWETLVCYQPMKWDSFAQERPTGSSFDFRVYIESDHFFSHEFADSSLWNCFRLTALDSDETLFGYAKIDEAVTREILDVLKTSNGSKTSVIVRVRIPEGLQSRRGVVIEKLLSPRWIYLDPPDSSIL